MTVLVPPDEWVGLINLCTGRVTRYRPWTESSALFRRRRQNARVSNVALFHTHPPPLSSSTAYNIIDRPSSKDIYATLRLEYPVHMVVTVDGVYVLVKTHLKFHSDRRYELFRRLTEWEDHRVPSPQQVAVLLHQQFGSWGLQCRFYSFSTHGTAVTAVTRSSVIQAVETVASNFLTV
jgi:hypothetical protein